VRSGDPLARYGGEEFGLVMPGSDLDTGEVLVERLRRSIPEGVTCSAGLAVWDGREAADALVARADGALYAAKHAGATSSWPLASRRGRDGAPARAEARSCRPTDKGRD